MKIAFIVGIFPKLSETFILNQIIGLIDLGHNVEIFSMTKPGEEKIHPEVEEYGLLKRTHYLQDFTLPANKVRRIFKATGLICIHIWKHPWAIVKALNVFKLGKKALSLRILFNLRPFLKSKFDIIHCHFGPTGKQFLFLKRMLNIKFITTFHAYDISLYLKQAGEDIYQDLFVSGDLFLPVSNYWQARLIQLGCPQEKIIVHHMGIDLQKFKFSSRQSPSGGRIKILTVVRLVEKKGLNYSIKAVARAIQKYSGIRYKIVGDGPLRDELNKLISKLGVAEKIRLVGWKDSSEVRALMEEAHIFLLHSVTATNGDMEGIPVSLMEAQAVGLPVISTDHSGIPELVQDGKSGFLVSERDIDAFSERLSYLIEHPEEWPEMGRNGRRIVEERYDNVQLSKKLESIYI